MSKKEVQQTISFLMEIDKLKSIERKNLLRDESRQENSAEHSWHLAIMVILLIEHAPPGVDLLKAIKMTLIHDLVEIYAGDTFCFDEDSKEDQVKRETEAAAKVFSLLPERQRIGFLNLWNEFESFETPTSKYVVAIDRLQPFLQSHRPEKTSVIIDELQREEYFNRLSPIKDAIPDYWLFVEKEIAKYNFTEEANQP